MRKKILTLLIILFGSCYAMAQQPVSGTVKNSDGSFLEGATISVKGGKANTVSDKNGYYQINVPGSKAILVFSYVGHVKKEIAVGNKSTLNVTLEAVDNALNDIVIVGYGTQRKKDVTVSIEKVNMADLNKAPVRSFDEALAGRVAGVQVTSSDGQPGSSSNIVIRGNNSITQDNSPLYIIDGFPVENSNNNAISPDDIESIEVLKDASATAIYGSRGANGVIIITTKKGKAGAPVISFNTSYGLQNVVKKIDMMSPYEFVRQQLEIDTSTSNSSPSYAYLTLPGRTLDSYKSEPGIDWQSLVLRQASMQNNYLSISGGNEGTRYSVSGSVLNQDGIIINSNYTRYQGRVVLDQTVNKKLKVGINSNYTYLKQAGASPSQSTNSATTNVMYGVWGQRPITPAGGTDIVDLLFDPGVNTANDYRINPVINLQNAARNYFTKNLTANAYAEYAIFPDLKLRVTGGINSIIQRAEIFNNSKTQYGNPITSANGVNGSLTYNEINTWLNENILSWNKKIDKNQNLNLVGVFSLQSGNTKSFGSSATFLPNESLGIDGLDEGTPQAITSTSSQWTLASFAFRAAYNYKSKYYLTGSYRADGSSRFAPGKRWGYFPSISAAWRFINEDFAKSLKPVLSDGKLRIGYGANGNNRVGDFAYLSTISLPIANSYTINNTPVRGSIPSAIGNPDLKWETTTETNLALDLGFLSNRITLTAEVYKKKTKDLLLLANLPLSSGYSSAFKNIGSVQNKGLEFTLNTINVNKKDFRWNSSFNISFNQNKVLALAENQESLTSTIGWDNNWQSIPSYVAKLNSALGLMYGYVWNGVYQISDFYQNTAGAYVLKDNVPTNGNSRANIQPGDIKYKDINGDGVVNSTDYTIIGNGLPKYTGGFTNNFTYKNFDLNVFFQWSYGNNILNINNLVFNGNGLNKVNLNQYASYNERWSPTDTTSTNFRTRGSFGGGYSSKLVEDGSYLRLKTLSLGYNISESTLKKFKIKSLRVYLAAQNLITWTNYSGIDPEVNTYNSALTPGFDYSAYPRARIITLGANLTF
ncbi:MAG TPA: TonB-dependent receptor [Chitinophagaceae bacterium]